MNGRLVLKDCAVYRSDGRVKAGLAVVIEERTIAQVAANSEVQPRPGDWVVECRGRIVAPGLTDAHTRLVGPALRDVSAAWLLESPASRAAVEERLVEALEPAEVGIITAAGLYRGLRRGVTCFLEHLEAPSQVGAALDAQAAAAQRLGARLITSHGANRTDAHLTENASFVERVAHSTLVRGSIGVPSAAEASEALLAKAGHLVRSLGCGAHISLTKWEEEIVTTWERFGLRPLARFERAGLLSPCSIVAFARSIDREEAARLASSSALVSVVPRAAHLADGSGSEVLVNHEPRVGLGTDGLSSLEQACCGAMVSASVLARAGRLVDPEALLATLLWQAPAQLVSSRFGAPVGVVDVGALADVVVFDAVPDGTHLGLQRLLESQASWVIVDGRVVIREGQLLGHDTVAIHHAAAAATRAVRARAGVA